MGRVEIGLNIKELYRSNDSSDVSDSVSQLYESWIAEEAQHWESRHDDSAHPTRPF